MDLRIHHTLLPFPDVFVLAGPDTFTHLARDKPDGENAVIIPKSFIDELDDRAQNSFSGGASDTLETLASLEQTPTGVEDITISEFLGTKIIFDHNPKINKRKTDIGHIEERINSIEGFAGKKLRAITTNSKHTIELKGQGISVEKPRFLLVDRDIVNKGIIEGNEGLLAKMIENSNVLEISEVEKLMHENFNEGLFLNQFIRFRHQRGAQYAMITGDIIQNKSGSRITDVKNIRLEMLPPQSQNRKLNIGNHFMNDILGIRPLDMEQYLALQYGILGNNHRALTFICGSQGSGKSLLSYVGAVDGILSYEAKIRKQRGMKDEKGGFFKKILLFKPNEVLGGKKRDPGALPGNIYDKLKPFMESYTDCHEESSLGSQIPFVNMLLHPRFENEFGGPRANNKINGNAHLPPNNPAFVVEHSGYMRGRSFRNSIILIDEAQNFTPYELKTLIDRAGLNCKVIIMGDPAQVDNPDCTLELNGLTYMIQHYLPKSYSSLIALSISYRHQMSAESPRNIYSR